MKYKTEWVQRKGDGKWVLFGLIPDPTVDIEEWDYYNKKGLSYYRWVQLSKAYDFMVELNAS